MPWFRGYLWVSEDWRISRPCGKILLFNQSSESQQPVGLSLQAELFSHVSSSEAFSRESITASLCTQSMMGFTWLHFGWDWTLFWFFQTCENFNDGIMVNPRMPTLLCPSHIHRMFNSFYWISFLKLLLQRNTGSFFYHHLLSLCQSCGNKLQLSQRFLSFFSFL